METTDTRRQARIIIILLVVVILGDLTWQLLRPRKAGKVRELTGATITAIDPHQRTAEIEFLHPKSGEKMRLAADVPAGCEILLDGKPLPLAELRVGDKVDVKGTINQTLLGASVHPQQVRVVRASTTPPIATAPAPATAPAAGTP